MATVHFILQGKGGVGKSFVAVMLAQYLKEKNVKTFCADTDPINATFASFNEFSVKHIKLLNGESNLIVQAAFDNLIEYICEAEEEAHIVVDNGASSFIPLINYLVENNVLDLLKSLGHSICLHSIITGGQALNDTLIGFDLLSNKFSKSASIVVWLNEYFGEIKADNKYFEQMSVYKKHAKSILGIITARLQPELFMMSLKKALEQRLSLKTAINSPDLKIMDKQRLTMIRRDFYEQLDVIMDQTGK